MSMANATQIEKARRFRELHQSGRILVLPNTWDAASARVFEDAGFGAVGTTSAGVAWALGYPDGQVAPRDDSIDAIRRIVRAVRVPVTADVERASVRLPPSSRRPRARSSTRAPSA